MLFCAAIYPSLNFRSPYDFIANRDTSITNTIPIRIYPYLFNKAIVLFLINGAAHFKWAPLIKIT